MSADSHIPGEDKELYRRSIGFLNRAKELRGLSPAAVDRFEQRLQRPRPRAWLVRRPGLLAATFASVILLIGTLAVARVGLRRVPLLGPLLAPHVDEPSAPPTRRARRHAIRTAGESESASPTTVLDVSPATPAAAHEALAVTPALQATSELDGAERIPEPSEPAAAAPRVRARLALATPQAAPRQASPAPANPPAVSPTPENPVLAESRSFSAAIESWHRNHDPVAALVALNEHDHHFPGGHLQSESRLLRAEIFLAQGRERDGLDLLDRMNLAASPRSRELYTVRGELRVKAGRCSEARADFSEVLARSIADGFGKRAAEALSHCP